MRSLAPIDGSVKSVQCIIRIDVEGAELEVLSNQVRMLNEVRPVIVCKGGSNTADEITKLLASA
jgi:hypothetical protein